MTITEIREKYGEEEAKFVNLYKGVAIYNLEKFDVSFRVSIDYDDEIELMENIQWLSGFDGFELIKPNYS